MTSARARAAPPSGGPSHGLRSLGTERVEHTRRGGIFLAVYARVIKKIVSKISQNRAREREITNVNETNARARIG